MSSKNQHEQDLFRKVFPPQAICLKYKEKCHIKIIFGSIVFVFLNVNHLVKANLSTMESYFYEGSMFIDFVGHP